DRPARLPGRRGRRGPAPRHRRYARPPARRRRPLDGPAAMMDPSRSVGQTPEAKQLRLLADDLVTLLDAQTPQLIAGSSRDDWDRARLCGRTATGLLRYHFWMADTSPGRMARLLALRDSMMAANLFAIAERRP